MTKECPRLRSQRPGVTLRWWPRLQAEGTLGNTLVLNRDRMKALNAYSMLQVEERGGFRGSPHAGRRRRSIPAGQLVGPEATVLQVQRPERAVLPRKMRQACREEPETAKGGVGRAEHLGLQAVPGSLAQAPADDGGGRRTRKGRPRGRERPLDYKYRAAPPGRPLRVPRVLGGHGNRRPKDLLVLQRPLDLRRLHRRQPHRELPLVQGALRGEGAEAVPDGGENRQADIRRAVLTDSNSSPSFSCSAEIRLNNLYDTH